MKELLVLVALMVTACGTVPSGPVVGSVPGGTAVCSVIDSSKFDLALQTYDAALDAINLLINAKVLIPGSARAKAVADANDRVMAAFKAADAARHACNATSYRAALDDVTAGVAQVRAAIHGG